jgi:hypothetical protein
MRPTAPRATSLLASTLVTGDRGLAGQALEQGQRAIEILQPLPDTQTDAGAYWITGLCQRLEGDDASDPAARAGWYRKALDNLLRARAMDRAQRQQRGRHPVR